MREVLRTHPNQQEIAGLTPDSNAAQNVDTPTVVRRGTGDTIRWKSESNSPEDNLRLGISNIRALVIAEVPELATLPRDENGALLMFC